jgi:hypothetical protein
MANVIYFDQLVSDIITIIHNQLNFPNQVHLRLVSKNFTKYPITNLFDGVPHVYKLSNHILKSYPFIIKLNAWDNKKITDVNHLKSLQILAANNNCGIDNQGISALTNLISLNVTGNKKITDINHLINLRILYARNCSGIADNGINLLTNLTKLDAMGNKKIVNTNHLVSLQILEMGYDRREKITKKPIKYW